MAASKQDTFVGARSTREFAAGSGSYNQEIGTRFYKNEFAAGSGSYKQETYA
jgi:hypothetical protein